MVLTIGAYAALTLRVWIGLPLWVSLLGGIAASTVLGMGIEFGIYRPLRKSRASSTSLLLASLGIYVALQACVSLVFGSGTQTFRLGSIPAVVSVLSARVTVPQIGMVITSAACWLLIWLLVEKTTLGTQIRAVASDPELTEAYGLNRDRIIVAVVCIGSALAGIAAIFLAYDTDMTPVMGFRVLLMGMVAVIIGGIGSIPGIAAGALLVGFAQHLGAWWISSAWTDPIVFLILILFLLVKPQGFFGKPLRKITV